MSASPTAHIAALLRELFTADELRAHLADEPDGHTLVDALPGHAASYKTIANEAAGALGRRGLVDAGFFERLAAARPHMHDVIRRVREAWFASAEPAANDLWSGRYRLESRLGGGGFAAVWCAVDEQTGQLVALKILHAHHHGNPAVRTRFMRGARTLAGLSHPSIVRVLGPGESGARCFFAMEYVRGVTLEVCVRERRYTPEVLLALTLQIGDALAHVHHHGLLHRDIKPSNIIVTGSERARLIDFDLVTGDDYVGLTTEAIGTMPYMPPEAGTSERKTAAYDVFSLARTVEFVLLGRELTARELADGAELPASAAVRSIVRAALQPDPQRRIADMATFCDALRKAQAQAQAQAAAPAPAPDPDPELAAALHASGPRLAAIASLVGLGVWALFLAPNGNTEKALPFVLALGLPSVRVLTEFLPGKGFDAVHRVWTTITLLPLLAVGKAMCDTRSTTTIKATPALVLVAALVLGAYASFTWLQRPRPGGSA